MLVSPRIEAATTVLAPHQRYVARQPILDRHQAIIGYELLFRSGMENFFAHGDGDEASTHVIHDSLAVIGFNTLVGDKKAFINITRGLLLQEVFALLPHERTVIELLETIEPDPEVIAACQQLKQKGYRLALDDFLDRPDYEPLVRLADIIKVDFQQTQGEPRRRLSQRLAAQGIPLLAEKVETRTDFEEALELGYHYFQGYFFCEPEIVARPDIPAVKLHCMRLLTALYRPQVDFPDLVQLIKHEYSLSVKLLQYLNSALFGRQRQITSIQHALVLLGIQRLKKLASLVALTALSEAEPPALLLTCLIRARFCELLGPYSDLAQRETELFLTGLLSALDVIVGRPLDVLLAELSVAPEIRSALAGNRTPLGRVYALVRAYEQGDWERVAELVEALQLETVDLAALYGQAIAWADELNRQAPQG